MIDKPKNTVVFNRRLRPIQSKDQSINEIAAHLNYMQEQLEYQLRLMKRSISKLEEAE